MIKTSLMTALGDFAVLPLEIFTQILHCASDDICALRALGKKWFILISLSNVEITKLAKLRLHVTYCARDGRKLSARAHMLVELSEGTFDIIANYYRTDFAYYATIKTLPKIAEIIDTDAVSVNFASIFWGIKDQPWMRDFALTIPEKYRLMIIESEYDEKIYNNVGKNVVNLNLARVCVRTKIRMFGDGLYKCTTYDVDRFMCEMEMLARVGKHLEFIEVAKKLYKPWAQIWQYVSGASRILFNEPFTKHAKTFGLSESDYIEMFHYMHVDEVKHMIRLTSYPKSRECDYDCFILAYPDAPVGKMVYYCNRTTIPDDAIKNIIGSGEVFDVIFSELSSKLNDDDCAALTRELYYN